MTTLPEPKISLWQSRYDQLLAHLREGGPCHPHNNNGPGVSADGRFALLAHSEQDRELTRVNSRERAQVLASAMVTEGWIPTMLYDLDELEPIPAGTKISDGDIVRYDDQLWHAYSGNDSWFQYILKSSDTAIADTIAAEAEIELVQVGDTPRLPVGYEVAHIAVLVAFNSIANPTEVPAS